MTQKALTRRNVLKGLAYSPLAFAGLAPAALQAADFSMWDLEADVIVVGSGLAGTCAAIAAGQAGRSVLVLEKMPFVGGTTAKSGGVMWIPNNIYLRNQAIADSRDDALRYMVRCSYPDRYNPALPTLGAPGDAFEAIATFYDQGYKVLDHLIASTDLRIVPWLSWDELPYPDYYAALPENTVERGRSIVPDVSGHPDRVIWKRGGGSGESLLWQLQKSFPKFGVRVLLEHQVTALTRNAAGAINGVIVDTGEEQPLRIRADRAVIFGTGGFSHHPEMAQQFLKGRIWGSCAAPGSTGDFIPIATGAGAALGNMGNAWWGQLAVEAALKTRSVPAQIWSTPGDSMIQVNRYGRRFVNEKIQYNERTQAHFTWDPSRAEYPNQLSFMIWDARTAQHYAGYDPIPAANAKLAHVIEGDTLETLVANIGERLGGIAEHTGALKLDEQFLPTLQASIARYNELAKKGEDEDFGRGRTPIEIAFQFFNLEKAPNEYPNMTMHPVAAQGPYYAAILGAGTLDTKGGAIVNVRGQVLDAQREPISGLYAAGNCVAHPAAQAYWGGGGTLGPHLTFGFLAGKAAAAEPSKVNA